MQFCSQVSQNVRSVKCAHPSTPIRVKRKMRNRISRETRASRALGTPREIGSSAMVAEKNDFDRTRYSKTKFFHANQSMQKCVSS